MAVDQNGLVTIEPAKGTAAGRAAIEAVIVPTPTQFSFAALSRACLDALSGSAFIAVDVTNRKVFFTDDPTKGAAMRTAVSENEAANAMKMIPVTGQTGRSLAWVPSAGEWGQTSVDFEAAVNLVFAQITPKFSVESLVTKLVALQDENGGTLTPSVILIDQDAGEVWAVKEDNGGLAALAALNLNVGNSGQLTLSEPEVTGTASALVFEGGLTGS